MKTARLAVSAILVTLAGALQAEGPDVSGVPKPASQPAQAHSFTDPVRDFVRDDILKPVAPFELVPGKDPNGWSFAVEPYIWAMGLSGTTGVGGAPTLSVNYNPRKILQQLDWAVMGMAEVRKGRWGLLADGLYAELSGSGDLGGVLYKSGSLNIQQGLASLALAYRIVDDRRGFLDLYAGARYNYLGLDVSLNEDSSGIQTLSTGMVDRVTAVINTQAQEIVRNVREEVRATLQNAKAALADRLVSDVTNRLSATAQDLEAAAENVGDSRPAKRDRKMLRDLRDRGLGQRGVDDRSGRAFVKHGIELRKVEDLRNFYRPSRNPGVWSRGALAEYVRATVNLEIARARNEDTSELESRASAAKAKASKQLAQSIENAVPTSVAGDRWWIDPIIGLRGQINFTRWLYLTAQADVGGFGAGSDLAWNALAAFGVNFTRNVFGELGYRYMYVDYDRDNFLYQMNQFGIFSSIGVKF